MDSRSSSSTIFEISTFRDHLFSSYRFDILTPLLTNRCANTWVYKYIMRSLKDIQPVTGCLENNRKV
jgi:hypothetical protein